MRSRESEPNVLGRRVQLDSISYSIIGVLPPGIVLQRGLSLPYWIPIGSSPGVRSPMQQDAWTIARLKPSVSLATATAETERFVKHSPENDYRSMASG